jgi:hypothetical protein
MAVPGTGPTTPGGLLTPGVPPNPGMPPLIPLVLLPIGGTLVPGPDAPLVEETPILGNCGNIGLVGPVGVPPGPPSVLIPYPYMPGLVTPVERSADPAAELNP